MAVSLLQVKKLVCINTLELFKSLLADVEQGEIIGSLVIVMHKDGTYSFRKSGALEENPTFASGAALVLATSLAKKAE